MMMPLHEADAQESIYGLPSLARVERSEVGARDAVSGLGEELIVRGGEARAGRPLMPPRSVADRTSEAD
jgi:hypothetical protein